jgi:hypothetical protein
MRDRKLATYSATECVSACTIAFLGGERRYLSPQARLGFHSTSFGSLDGKALPNLNTEMRVTLRAKGAPSWFIEKALGTSPDSMWYPTHEELISAGVVSRVVDADLFALSGLGPAWKDSAALRSGLEEGLNRTPVMAVLKESEPEAYERIVMTMTKGVQEGGAVIDMQHELANTVMAELLPKYLQGGRDAEVVAYWSVQIEELRHLHEQNPRACMQFLLPEMREASWNGNRLVPKELLDRDLTALANLVRAGTMNSPGPAWVTPSEEELAAVYQRTVNAMPGADKILEKPKDYAAQPEALCRAFLTYYLEIMALPLERSAAFFRYLAMP